MNLVLEDDDDGTQVVVIRDLEDYLDEPATIMKQIKLAIRYLIKTGSR